MGGNRGPSRALAESAAVGLFILRGAGKPRALAAGRGYREVLRRREAALPGTSPPLPGPPCVQPSSVTGLLLGKSDLDQ